jgi:uncharacterized protein (DUF2252 family)
MNSTDAAIELHPTLDVIRRASEGREPSLVRLKYQRMAEDLFAFFRGANPLFAAAWPGLVPLDPGPSILISGDLHLENFGAYRAEDGDFVFDINDFDEALVAPCSLDLVRCSTSILLAAEVWRLSPIQAMRMVQGYLDRYRVEVAEAAKSTRIPLADEFGPIGELLGKFALGTQARLLDHMTKVGKSGVRSIRRSDGKLPPIDQVEAAGVIEAIEAHGQAIGQAEAFRVLDVSSRIAGIGSLGVKRFVALVEGDGATDGNRLLDLKAARPSSLLGCTEAPQPTAWLDDAQRVVDAQRRLQARPTAGLDVIRIDGEDFRLRELIPDENRAKLDRFRRKPSKLRRAVEIAGTITAWSQLRGARLEDGNDRTDELTRWAASPALDAVLASAVRFAQKSREDYKVFRKAKLDRELG